MFSGVDSRLLFIPESICHAQRQAIPTSPKRLWFLQGAVLSPFFFNILMDHVRREDAKLLKYVDDLVLCHPEKTLEDTRAMSEAIAEIQSCSDTRGLLLNPDKCKQTIFRIRTSSLTHSTQVPFESVTSINYLGITFSADTTWSPYIESLFECAHKLCYYVRHLRQFNLPQSYIFQFMFFQACILSKVLYCSPVVFPGLMVKDYVILRRLLRHVAGGVALHYEQLVDVLVKRHLNDCKLLANRILSNTKHPVYFALSPAVSTRNTRQQYRLLPARTSRYRNSVIPYLARFLNDSSKVQDDLKLHLQWNWAANSTCFFKIVCHFFNICWKLCGIARYTYPSMSRSVFAKKKYYKPWTINGKS